MEERKIMWMGVVLLSVVLCVNGGDPAQVPNFILGKERHGNYSLPRFISSPTAVTRGQHTYTAAAVTANSIGFPWNRTQAACQGYGGQVFSSHWYYEGEIVGEMMAGEAFWIGLKIADDDPNSLESHDGQRMSIAALNWGASQPDLTSGRCVYGQQKSGETTKYYLDMCNRPRGFVCVFESMKNSNYLSCNNGKNTYKEESHCDGVVDCPNAYDETYCGPCDFIGYDASGSYHFEFSDEPATCHIALATVISNKDSITSGFKIIVNSNAGATFDAYTGALTEIDGPFVTTLRDLSELIIGSPNVFLKYEYDGLSPGNATITFNRLTQNEMCDSSVTSNPDAIPYDTDCLTVFPVSGDPFTTISASILENACVDAYVELYDGAEMASDNLLMRFENSEKNSSVKHFAIATKGYVTTRFYRGKTECQGIIIFRLMPRMGCDLEADLAEYSLPVYFNSPGYLSGNDYPPQLQCKMQFSNSKGIVSVVVIDFDMEDGQDFVQIKDGSMNTMANLTGSLNSLTKTTFTAPEVIFDVSTNRVIGNRGFSILVAPACPSIDINPDTTIVVNGDYSNAASLAKFTLQCISGYYFASEEYQNMTALDVECSETGTWNLHNTPICSKRYCGLPPELTNGYVSSISGVLFEDNVTYSCFSEFTLDGDAVVLCEDDGAWGTLPTCLGSTCSALNPVANSVNTTLKGGDLVSGTVVRFTCDPGYLMEGADQLVCIQGSWSSQSTCTIAAESLLMGSITGNAALLGESLEVECDPGFVMNGTASITCGLNGVFTELPECNDEDECLGSVCGFGQVCVNTIGSYVCSCDDGYAPDHSGGYIDECATIVDDCQDTCNCSNTVGSYECVSTLTGYVLYTANGTSGLTIPGFEENSVKPLRINKSCVRVSCPPIPSVLPHGSIYLGEEPWMTTSSLYQDEVIFQCDIGFKLNGSSKITCLESGRWDYAFPSCLVATCDGPNNILLSQADYPPSIDESVFPLPYGDTVEGACVIGMPVLAKYPLQCVFDAVHQNYTLVGLYDCPVVQCGEVNRTGTVPETQGVPLSLLYGSHFLFTCENAYLKIGQSGQGNDTVTCKSNGYWDYGTLQCVHVEPPKVLCEPSNTYYVERYSSLVANYVNWTAPTATDNTGVMMSVTPKFFNGDWLLTEDMVVNFTFTDYNSNSEWCLVQISIKDDSPPEFDCPESFTIFRSPSNITDEDLKKSINVTDDFGFVNVSYIVDRRDVISYVTIQATDDAGNMAQCSYSVYLAGSNCSLTKLDVPANTNRECYEYDGGANCTYSCASGYYFYDNTTTYVHICEDPIGWEPHFVHQCTEPTYNARWVIYTTFTYTKVDPASGDGLLSCLSEFNHTYPTLWPASEVSAEGYCSGSPKYDGYNVTYTEFYINGSSDYEYVVILKATIIPDGQESNYYNFCSQILNVMYTNFPSDFNILNMNLGSCGEVKASVNNYTGMFFCPGDDQMHIIDGLYQCFECGPGTYYSSEAKQCEACPVGHVKPLAGNAECVPCPSGQSTLLPGAKQYSECIAVVDVCADGFISPDQMPPCSPCAQGTYSVDAERCVACAGNQTTFYNGIGDEALCRSYTGVNCTKKIDNCASQPCYYGADCIDGNNTFTCNCSSVANVTVSGDRCEIEEDNCVGSTCDNGAMCQDDLGTYNCLCPLSGGYAGNRCQEYVDICSTTPCENGGNCTSISPEWFECLCVEGFEGNTCDVRSDPCASNPCLNGGACNNLDGITFYCTCAGPFNGTLCEEEIDICVDDCGSNGTCFLNTTSYENSCICEENFKVSVSGACEFDDPCLAANPCVSGTCSYENMNWQCDCDFGYEGWICDVDIDDCASHTCENGATCVDGTGNFTCNCAEGYEGFNCSEITDNCAAGPCEQGTCRNSLAGYACDCPPEWKGVNCTLDVDECADYEPCLNGATCNNIIGNYTCVCNPEWTGQNCEILLESCTNATCNDGTCYNLHDDFYCSCPVGMYGETCALGNVITDLVNPCFNNGTLVPGLSATCDCLDEFAGPGCEILKDPCAVNPCANGGSCVYGFDTFHCECSDGFSSDDCSVNFDDCSFSPCPNGRVCIDGINDHYCACSNISFFGDNCDHTVDPSFDYNFWSAGSSAETAYPFDVTNVSVLSLSLFVRYSWLKDEGKFFSLVLRNLAEDVPDKEVLFMDHNGVHISPDPKPNPFRFEINDLNWHNVVINMDIGQQKGTVYFDAVPFSINTTGMALTTDDNEKAFVIIGGGFIGRISQVLVYERTLTFAEVTSMQTMCTYQDNDAMLLNWADYETSAGVLRENPATCDDIFIKDGNGVFTWTNYGDSSFDLEPYKSFEDTPSEKECRKLCQERYHNESCRAMEFNGTDCFLYNKRYSHENEAVRFSRNRRAINDLYEIQYHDVGEADSVIENCPLDFFVYSAERRVVVTWTEPTSNSGDVTLTSEYGSGDTFVWGEYTITYELEDRSRLVYCSFVLSVYYWECDPATIGLTESDCSTNNNYTYCEVSKCANGLLPLQQPVILTCGPASSWSPLHPDVYTMSECVILLDSNSVETNVTYPLTAQTESQKTTLKNLIREVFQNWNTSVYPGLCVDSGCSNLAVTLDCLENVNCSVTFVILYDGPNFNTSAGHPMSVSEIITKGFYEEDAFDFTVSISPGGLSLAADGAPDVSTVSIASTTDCGRGFVTLGTRCYACPVGSKEVNGACEFCKMNEYQDEAAQTSCKPCSASGVTQTTGSTSASQCHERCAIGSFFNVTSNTCELCDFGFYQDQEGFFFCIACGPLDTTASQGTLNASGCSREDFLIYSSLAQPKTFSTADCAPGQELNQANGCDICPIGTYRTIDVNYQCELCPDGFITPYNESVSVADCTIRECFAGTYREASNNTCIPCPIGTFSEMDRAEECTSCFENQTTLSDMSDNRTACLDFCESGYQISGTGCVVCEKGSYRNADTDLFGSCSPCPDGFTTPSNTSADAADCTDRYCFSGTYLSDANRCEPCPIGLYQEQEDQKSCIQCPVGTSTVREGTDKAKDCLPECDSGFGYDQGNMSCIECAIGFYKDNSIDRFGVCLECPENATTAETASTSSANCSIPKCYAGSSLDVVANTCVTCAIGFYQPEDQQTECIQCPSAIATENTGSTRLDQCKILCPSGQESNVLNSTTREFECVECAQGFFRNQVLSQFGSCESCPSNVTTNGTGAGDISDCNLAACDPGSYRDANANICLHCPAGTYQDQQWQDSCLSCPEWQTFNYTGARSISDCESFCPSGSERNVNGTCSACPLGSYKNNDIDVFGECELCPEGYTTEGLNATSLAECDIANICMPCPIGQYQPLSLQEECLMCNATLSTLTEGSTDAAGCLCELFISAWQQFSCEMCLMAVLCGAGEEEVGGQCVPCQVGSYKAAPGVAACNACSGSYLTLNTGSTSSADCLYGPCALGEEYMLANSTCMPCPIGSFREDDSSPLCKPCLTQFITADVGADNSALCNVANCSAGTFLNIDNVCEACNLSSYQDEVWQTSCKPCPNVTKATSPGATSISECLSTNECEDNRHNCSEFASCDDNEESFTCICMEYYAGDGYTCSHLCDNDFCGDNAQCSKADDGAPVCNCKEGFSGDRCQFWNAGSGFAQKLAPWVIGGGIGVLVLLFILVSAASGCKASPKPPPSIAPTKSLGGIMNTGFNNIALPANRAGSSAQSMIAKSNPYHGRISSATSYVPQTKAPSQRGNIR
ncbi:hypothetical protein CAPTEDRAFT_227406 [Capitella teleta]|uniref:Sushi, von Willebrand factor type A, EGF and pentraxin domain-containing protein 1 n=1 Tax=Capitella teleta TaxID=283909 RepID=R7URF4_CAPTE|nr:hypothetical protein CAPTEDRAFT_227406 [Capitella teleta]|eukprot:ELU08713.1 hypothetical protein CAPTEDRAFT_227406 [Capitella teleta]